MYVCICNAITDREIRDTIGFGVHSFEELSEILGVSKNCGKCKEMVEQLLETHNDNKNN